MTKRQVFADYFTSFKTRELSGHSGIWRYYQGDKVQWSGDLYEAPGSERKEIASPYYPVIGPYDTLDPDVLEYHILLAKLTGIDGFFCEYDVAHGHDSQVPLLMAQLGKKFDFQVGVHWVPINFTNREPDLQDRVQMLAAAKACLLLILEKIYKVSGIKIDGSPVILFFGIRASDYLPTIVKDTIFSAAEIQALREASKGYHPLFFAPHFQAELLSVMDGFYPWVLPLGSDVPSGSPYDRIGDLAAQRKHLHHFYTHAQKSLKDQTLHYAMGGVWPGFDDHRGRAWGEDLARYVPREQGEMLKLTWDLAKAAHVDTILHVTWNDWVESTMIEPSVELGYTELEATQREISIWKDEPLAADTLRLPIRLLKIRRQIRRFSCLNFPATDVQFLQQKAETIALTLAQTNATEATALLHLAEEYIQEQCLPRLLTYESTYGWIAGQENAYFIISSPHAATPPPVSPLEETLLGFTAPLVFQLTASLFKKQHQIIEGKLRLRYFDQGTGFFIIKQGFGTAQWEIANFRKQDTHTLRTIELELVPILATASNGQLTLQLESDSPSQTEWLHSFHIHLRRSEFF